MIGGGTDFPILGGIDNQAIVLCDHAPRVFGIGDREEGRWVFERMVSTRGARFGEAFDADDVEITDWGRLEMTLDCEGGTARWTATETGFMDGAFDLDRLTQLDGTACP